MGWIELLESEDDYSFCLLCYLV